MEECLYCKICFKKCSGVAELKLHVESRHPNRMKLDNGEQPKETKKNDFVDELIFKSVKRYGNASEMPTEPIKKKNGVVKLSTKSIKRNKKEPEIFVDFNRLEREFVECNVCQEICVDESALIKHCERHLFRNYTTCGVCAKVFRSVYGVQLHFESHRSRIYACNICDEQYKTKEGLSQHVCSKVYPCNVCNQKFMSKDELLNHFFVHKSLQGSYLNFTGD